MRSRLISTATVLFLLAGCSAPAPETVQSSADGSTEIAWFDGSPDAAFARARTEGRPVFLYWGAEWCPPCHYLKDKIFRTPEFVERSGRFVMVYLDGDTQSAQTLGEELDVQGYPTVIVFSPEGDELLRMASDVPLDRYAGLMERAARLDRPVAAILGEVLAKGAAAADPSDLDVLAHHSWGQDQRIDLDDSGRLEAFRRLWRETPDLASVARSRFLWLYADALAGLDETPDLTTGERDGLRLALVASMSDPEERRANVLSIAFLADELVPLLTEHGTRQRDALVAAWDGAAAACEDDPEVALDDRLTCLAPRLELARLRLGDGADLPPELIAHTRRRVSWAGELARDDSTLQAVMSTMVFLLQEAGLDGEAETLITERMDETHAPYYFMSWLASIHEEAGRTDKALSWYRRAYDGSRGRYSRFRWGSIYLRNLLQLAPEDSDRIEADTLEVLDELLDFDDAFAGGNHLRLEQLGGALESWRQSGGDPAVVANVRDRVHAACDGYPGDDEGSPRRRCRSFLAGPA